MYKASLLFVLALVVGCAGQKELTTQDLNDMKAKATIGMPYREVLEVLGTPDADNYTDAEKSGFINYATKDRMEVLSVRFLEGKVSEVVRFGPEAEGN